MRKSRIFKRSSQPVWILSFIGSPYRHRGNWRSGERALRFLWFPSFEAALYFMQRRGIGGVR
jgi:hypothetical protein